MHVKKIKEVKKMKTEFNTPKEQNNEFANQSEETYYQYLSKIKINDTEEFQEDFATAFMFL